jgi:hypothetical protein
MSGSPQTENATSQGSRWSPPADDAVRNEKFGTPGGFDHHKQLALAAYAAGSSVSSLSKTPMSQLASIST